MAEQQKLESDQRRIEQQARKRLSMRGVNDPRNGQSCSYDDVLRYDEMLTRECKLIENMDW